MSEKNDEYIASLARKILTGPITEDEKAELEQWYDENPPQKPVWKLSDQSKEALGDRLFLNIRKNITPVKPIFPFWIKIAVAASLLLILATGAYFFTVKKRTGVEYNVAGTKGYIRKILLPDQSIVWLKGDSRLQYPAKFSDSTRNVVLHGEALFEVAKDHRHPFIILAGSYVTRVIGTSFNIREDRRRQSFKLTVLTGKVTVTALKNSDKFPLHSAPIVITPGNEFEGLNAGLPSAIKVSRPATKAAVTQGTDYIMNFESTSFTEVKSRIEHKFDVVINASDEIYHSCELSADVTDQSLDNTLKVVCAAIGAKYVIVNKQINITGGGCN